ncbi:hypothetical protein ACG3SL_07925 [Sphingomonas sp. CJ20]
MIRGARTHGGALQRMALLLVACALLLRIAVPAGWMPVAQAGGVTFNWCSDSSGREVQTRAQSLLANALGKDSAPKEKPGADQPCAFAATAQPATGTDSPVLLPPIAAAAPVALRPLPVFPGRGLAAPPPLSTGPPALA